ncbi:hypothetical protein RV134_310335 [Roseovarius sp. EC-HK134]|nr:hypothetical protein RV420_360441 [Roseovarius sp. EC-SD190]VVT21382.1 hypothetical protein RV134_310335 [Roseovarius sp. EC-HK134]
MLAASTGAGLASPRAPAQPGAETNETFDCGAALVPASAALFAPWAGGRHLKAVGGLSGGLVGTGDATGAPLVASTVIPRNTLTTRPIWPNCLATLAATPATCMSRLPACERAKRSMQARKLIVEWRYTPVPDTRPQRTICPLCAGCYLTRPRHSSSFASAI